MKISSRKYFDTRLKDLYKYVKALRKDDQEAIKELAKTTTDYRAGHNDLLGKMREERGTYITRRELTASIVVILTFMLTIVGLLISLYNKK